MNWIGSIAKKYPAIGRFIEITLLWLLVGGIISLINGSITYLETGEPIQYIEILKTFLTGILIGVSAGLTKFQRTVETTE